MEQTIVPVSSAAFKYLRIPKHIAGLRALGGADDTLLLHHFDEACSAVEADFKAALDVADAGLALLKHDFESFFKKGVRPLFIEQGRLTEGLERLFSPL